MKCMLILFIGLAFAMLMNSSEGLINQTHQGENGLAMAPHQGESYGFNTIAPHQGDTYIAQIPHNGQGMFLAQLPHQGNEGRSPKA